MVTSERPTVLLVEDDNATREMFDYALRMAGYSVTAVRDGFAALRSIEQQCPDIVVLDLDLPHVSGLDVHQELVSHAETCKIPIVVVTGTSWQAPPEVFRMLRKPIPSDVLVTTIEQALAQPREQATEDTRPRPR
ncbi:MAG TPA: response regulator [Vicinamibacterales bacterium]|jgi:CheY-like chemotaxis protein|nr:response regulator [Vicinamibacterales bacterium]